MLGHGERKTLHAPGAQDEKRCSEEGFAVVSGNQLLAEFISERKKRCVLSQKGR